MDPKKLLISVLSALGATLTENSSDEEITAEADRLSKKPEPAAPAAETMSAKKPTEVEAFAARLDKIESDAVQARKDAAVKAATAEGKVIAFSAEEIQGIPEATLYSHIAKLKSGTVPTGSTISHAQPGKDANLTVDAEEAACVKQFSAQLGLSEDDMKKYAAKN